MVGHLSAVLTTWMSIPHDDAVGARTCATDAIIPGSGFSPCRFSSRLFWRLARWLVRRKLLSDHAEEMMAEPRIGGTGKDPSALE